MQSIAPHSHRLLYIAILVTSSFPLCKMSISLALCSLASLLQTKPLCGSKAVYTFYIRLWVYYFLSLTLSVCMSVCPSVCHAAPSNRFFFFVYRWNRSIFGRHLSMWHSTKYFSSIFDLGPLTPLLPQICNCKKSPISRLAWQIKRRCLGLLGGFRVWPIQWNHAKCCGTYPQGRI